MALIREAGFASAELVRTASPLLVGLIRARA
jgi:hypothetical protein